MVKSQEVAIVFEVRTLNDELEELIPIKVITGIYNNNRFKDVSDNVIYEHIENIKDVGYGYCMRNIYESEENEDITEVLEAYFKSYNGVKYYRYKTKPQEMLVSIPGTGMISYSDVDSCITREKVIKEKPMSIEKKIKEAVKGQDEAIKKIVTTIWMNINFPKTTKRNMLVIGPDGVGKKMIFEKLKEILDIPLVVFSVSSLVEKKPALISLNPTVVNVESILSRICLEGEGDFNDIDRAIVILDGIDKLVYSDEENIDDEVQSELTKVIQGVEKLITFEESPVPISIDTTKTIFVGMGSFKEEHKRNTMGFENDKSDGKKPLRDKLVKYGMTKELASAFPVIVEANKLTKDVIKDILLHSSDSELIAINNDLKRMNVVIKNLDMVADMISEEVINNGYGAKGIIPVINKMFANIFYEIGNKSVGYAHLVIGTNILEDPNDFKLDVIKKKAKVKVRINKTKE